MSDEILKILSDAGTPVETGSESGNPGGESGNPGESASGGESGNESGNNPGESSNPDDNPAGNNPSGEPGESGAGNQGGEAAGESGQGGEPGDDASLLKALKELGVKTIDDLKNIGKKEEKEEHVKDDPKEIAAKKEKIKEYAKQVGVKTELFEEYEEDAQKSPIELAFKQYQLDRAGELNEATDEPYTEEELRQEFEDENLLFEEDGHPARKRAEKKLKLIADTYLADKYAAIKEAENGFLKTSDEQKNNQVLSNTVNAVKSILEKEGLSYAIKDELGAEIKIKLPLSKNTIEAIKLNPNEVTSPDDTESVRNAFVSKILVNDFGKIIHEIATSYHSQKILGKKAESIGIESRKAEFEKMVSAEVPAEIRDALIEAEQRN